ncbi:hypothetical protein [Candidatus Solirubrobacter pratensis]|uniref:hypothetical protein n=1 Tax=Candidatus Solirubrobacter pratensis TaxID=1298857 RepID=UPI001E2E8094|nr:hypothetical protein [Candidatus Solirubrobacter pratensis]
MDRLVAASPEQFIRAVIAERTERGGVREPDHAVRIHDPDRLPGRLQHGGEKVLSADVQAGEIGERACHAKPPKAVQSTPGSCAAEGKQRESSPERGTATARWFAAGFDVPDRLDVRVLLRLGDGRPGRFPLTALSADVARLRQVLGRQALGTDG